MSSTQVGSHFLALNAGYMFKIAKPRSSTQQITLPVKNKRRKIHNRNRSSYNCSKNEKNQNILRLRCSNSKLKKSNNFKQYRAYDKQRLLQQIINKAIQHNQIISQNMILKQSIKSASTKNATKNVWSSPQQVKSMIEILRNQNNVLAEQLNTKQNQLKQLKKSTPYTSYLLAFIQYSHHKQQLQRVKKIYKARKANTINLRQQIYKQRQIHLLQNKINKKTIIQTVNRLQNLKEYLNSMQQQFENCKIKSKKLQATRNKLTKDINDLKQKTNFKRQLSSLKTKRQKSPCSILFNQAVKTKGSLKRSQNFINQIKNQHQYNNNIGKQNKQNIRQKQQIQADSSQKIDQNSLSSDQGQQQSLIHNESGFPKCEENSLDSF